MNFIRPELGGSVESSGGGSSLDTMFGNVILQTPETGAYADESIYGHTFTLGSVTDNGDGSISLTAATQNAYFNIDWPRTHFYNGEFIVEFELTTPSTIVSGYKYLISSSASGSNYFAWGILLYSASGTTGNPYIVGTDAEGSYDLVRTISSVTLSESTTYNIRFGRIANWVVTWIDDVLVDVLLLTSNGFGTFATGNQLYFGDLFGANSALATFGRVRITRGFNQHFVDATVTDENGVSLENHTLCVADNVATSISSAIACRGNLNDSTAIQSGMYLRADGSASYSPGTGAFCVRFWFKAPSSTSNSKHVLSNGSLTSTSTHDWVVYVSSGGLLGVYDYVSAASLALGTTDMHDGAWHYCVAARDGSGNIAVFVDGTREATASNSVDLGNASYDILIGTDPVGGEELYLISDIELIVGATPIDPTSSSHTVPTDYVTTHANSVLHIKGNWRDDGFNTSGWATAVGSNDACSHFHAGIYVGTGASKTVPLPFDISEGGAIIVNNHSASWVGRLFSTLRGVNTPTQFYPVAEASVANTLTAFGASSFTIGTHASVNQSGEAHTFWAFHLPSSRSDAIDGTTIDWIYNDVSKVALGVIDRSTGGSSASLAIDLSFLGLSGAPAVLMKNLDDTSSWVSWSSLLTSGYYQTFSSTSAESNTVAAQIFGNNSTTVDPTATTLTLGNQTFVGGNATVGAYEVLIMVFGDSDFVATAVDPAGSTASSLSFADTGFTRTPASALFHLDRASATNKFLIDRATGGNSISGTTKNYHAGPTTIGVGAGFFTGDGDYVTGGGITTTTTYFPVVFK